MDNRFQKQVELEGKFEKAGSDFMDAVMELAKEISGKPRHTHTEAEKNFVKSVALIGIHMLLKNASGGSL